jgi:ribosomal protein S21
MAVAVVRKQNETSEKLISRLQKKVQGARIVMKLKRGRHHERNTSRRLQKQTALKREFYRGIRRKMQHY